MEANGQIVDGRINMDLDSTKQYYVDCIASGARPGPNFNWYIGQDKLNANIQPSEETDENGQIKYKSTLEYNADAKHNGQQLKCEVTHIGYTLQSIEDRSNWAEADLDLQCKLTNVVISLAV